jgi:uridine kinase
VLVAIDGPDAAGKTRFADDFAVVLRKCDRGVIRVSVDDFHNPRTVRYRRGRDSPEGYWLDAFDYDRLRADVLTPLAPGGTRRYRARAHELRTDAELDPRAEIAEPGDVVVIDGVFLLRDELRAYWDFAVFIDVSVAVTIERLAGRDGLVPDRTGRYVKAHQLYRDACSPLGRADVVINNNDAEMPEIVRGLG